MSATENVTDELKKNVTRVMAEILKGSTLPRKAHTIPDLSPSTVTFVISLLCTVIVVAVVGNIIALVALQVCRELRNTTCYFITSLCISDLMVSLLSLPFWISFIHSGWPSKKDGLVYKLWICLDIFCGCFSISNLSLISIERYIYIMFPLNFETIITKKRAKLLTGITPLYGILVSIIGFIRMAVNNPFVIIPVVFLAYVIPVAIMCFANGSTFLVTMSHLKSIGQEEKDRKRLISSDHFNKRKADQSKLLTSSERTSCLTRSMTVKERSRKFKENEISIKRSSTVNEIIDISPELNPVRTDASLSLLKLQGIKEWEEYVSKIEKTAQNQREGEHERIHDGDAKVEEGKTKNNTRKERSASDDVKPVPIIDFPEKHTRNQSLPKTEDPKQRCMWRLRGLKRELKAARATGLIIGTFLLLWTPFMVVVLLNSFNVQVRFKTAMIVKTLHYTNSAINPILYVVLNKCFRETLRKLPGRVKY